jgi:hypothetical protein
MCAFKIKAAERLEKVGGEISGFEAILLWFAAKKGKPFAKSFEATIGASSFPTVGVVKKESRRRRKRRKSVAVTFSSVWQHRTLYGSTRNRSNFFVCRFCTWNLPQAMTMHFLSLAWSGKGGVQEQQKWRNQQLHSKCNCIISSISSAVDGDKKGERDKKGSLREPAAFDSSLNGLR